MVWFEAMALLSRVFQKLFNGENGLYITEFEGTFKETVCLQDMTLT